MHVLSITKLLGEIIFNKDFDFSKLESLNQQEKDIFVNYISQCRVESYVLKKIGKIGAKSLGSENYIKLKNYAANRTIRTLENIRLSNKINLELSSRKIKHIFLKGINMHRQIYLNMHDIRPISDIDILIKKDDFIEVMDISHELGFDISRWKAKKEEDYELYRNPNPFHKNGQAQLDIHTTIKGSIYQDKIDFNLFVKDLISSNKNYCTLEMMFIHCLFHGTRKSDYNVGPIFIVDLLHFFYCERINWFLVSKKVVKYGLEKELGYVLKYFDKKVVLPSELIKFLKPNDITESELNAIFLSRPKSSAVFSVYSTNGLRVLIKKLFSKKFIKDHNLQKFTFTDVCNNFFKLIQKNLILKDKIKGEISISRVRFKLLRKK